MKIKILDFKGEVPSVSDEMLPDTYAAVAHGCNFQSRNLAAFKDYLTNWTTTKVGVVKSIYRWAATHVNAGYWFHWITDVDAVRGPITQDTTERTYFTGDGAPKMTYSPIAVSGGGTNYPTNTYTLGLPAPADAPVVTLEPHTSTITDATKANPVVITSVAHGLDNDHRIFIDNVVGMTELNGNQYDVIVIDEDTFSLLYLDGTEVNGASFSAYVSGGTWYQTYSETDLETRAYVYTYVSALGEEGPPSPASNTLDVGYDEHTDVSGMSAAPTGAYNVAYKRIYRTATVNGTTAFYYVSQVAVGTATYHDDVHTQSLGEQLPQYDWVMPPSTLAGLRGLDNGIMVGFSLNDVCFSEPWQPHAWPVEYRQTTDFPVVALSSFGNTVVAVTEKNPYLIIGTSPRSMSMTLLNISQGCVSKRGMVGLGDAGVAYPSPDGLILISGSGGANLTEDYFTRTEWQALAPTSFLAAVHDGKYFCAYDNGVDQGMFVFDPRQTEQGVVFFDIYPTAMFADHLADTLFLQIGTNIVAWEGDTTKMSYTWRSKRFRLDDPVTFSAGLVDVIGTPTDAVMKLYVDGSLKHTQSVTDSTPFRMPGGYMSRDFQIELSGSDTIHSVAIAEAISELAA